MKKALFLAVVFLLTSMFNAVRVYKTKEIPFLNDVVEGMTKVIGVKSDVVVQKAEKREVIIEKERERILEKQRGFDLSLIEMLRDSIKQLHIAEVKIQKVEAKADKQESLLSRIASEEVKPQEEQKAITATVEPVKKKRTLFDNISSDSDGKEDGGSVRRITNNSFGVTVFDTQGVKNDGTITLRLSEPVKIKGKDYPQGFVFEATTALASNRLTLRSDKLGVQVINYTDGFEGQPLAKHWLKGKEVTLSKGESLILSY